MYSISSPSVSKRFKSPASPLKLLRFSLFRLRRNVRADFYGCLAGGKRRTLRIFDFFFGEPDTTYFEQLLTDYIALHKQLRPFIQIRL